MKQPAKVIRLGNISATIWDNDTWYSTKIVRNYQKDEKWHESSDFRPSDLPVVMAVAEAAMRWILNNENATKSGS